MTTLNVISVDVGTGSVRAALTSFDSNSCGNVLSTHSQNSTTYNPRTDFYEQNSQEIWSAVVSCIRSCLEEAGIDEIHGIAFTATCSLVVIDAGLQNDIIMWMDHRSVDEAASITATQHRQLNQTGGICSPEFSIAKLLWLKKNESESYEKARGFLELPDYLTWKCLDCDIADFAPSNCSLTCKWFYDAESNSWNEFFVEAIGLEDLFNTATKSRVGTTASLPGTQLGFMTEAVKEQMGINPTCKVAVASSIIDAHAGVLAMIAMYPRESMDVESLICSIAGTSTCNMILNAERREIRGIWGPYLNVVTKGHYVHEPGQSATGKLVDFIVDNHKDKSTRFGDKSFNDITIALNESIEKKGIGNQKLVVNPSFHGNRCPLADPTLRGGIYGLDLESEPLENVYEATLESLCYETRFIIEELNIPELKLCLVSGGLLKNLCFMQIYADVLGLDVIGMDSGSVDMMLAGTAILARQGALKGDNSLESISNVCFKNLKLAPFKPNAGLKKYHDTKYQCYRMFVKCSQEMQKLLSSI